MSKKELKEFFSYVGAGLTVIFGAASIIGFMIGSFENDKCTYDSLASRINIGYVVGCELWAPRWKKPCAKKKVFSILNNKNYMGLYALVTFDDGSTKEMKADPAMIGKEMEVCE